MKVPRIIFSLVLISALIGGILAFKARETQRFVTYYFTTTSTVWSNPNNWVSTGSLTCPSPKNQLCGLVIYNPNLINTNGKPKVNEDPMNATIAFAIANSVEMFHTDFVVLLEP